MDLKGILRGQAPGYPDVALAHNCSKHTYRDRVTEEGTQNWQRGLLSPGTLYFLCCLYSQGETEINPSRAGGTAKEQKIPETTAFLPLPWDTALSLSGELGSIDVLTAPFVKWPSFSCLGETESSVS